MRSNKWVGNILWDAVGIISNDFHQLFLAHDRKTIESMAITVIEVGAELLAPFDCPKCALCRRCLLFCSPTSFGLFRAGRVRSGQYSSSLQSSRSKPRIARCAGSIRVAPRPVARHDLLTRTSRDTRLYLTAELANLLELNLTPCSTCNAAQLRAPVLPGAGVLVFNSPAYAGVAAQQRWRTRDKVLHLAACAAGAVCFDGWRARGAKVGSDRSAHDCGKPMEELIVWRSSGQGLC